MVFQLFQLRSIEQNELAIVSDSQNKAILVFTGVTIVFLPLSFFTSYYGMNLKGIIDTGLTQGYFWRVCGSIAFAIVLVIAFGAFRHRLKRALNPRRMRDMNSMV
jgi:Mg2+ and Co2+ transporter CorA